MNNNEEKQKKEKRIYIIILILVTVIAGIIRIFNLGWTTLFLLFFLILPVYITLFILSNVISINCMKYKSIIIKITFWISCFSFIITAMTLPDSDDSKKYAFFSLVRDLDQIKIFNTIAYTSGIINFITVIIGFCAKPISNIKKKKIKEEIK